MTKNTRTNFSKDSATRISTQEIDEAMRQLESAYTEGRLDDSELEDRMAQATKAKTEGDLSALLADLARVERAMAPQTPPTKMLRRLQHSSVAVFSSLHQTGSFILPKSYHIAAIFGSSLIDLSNANLENQKSTIKIAAVFGSVEVIVPRGARIEIESTPIFGSVSKEVPDEYLPPDAPVIHLIAEAIFGSVEIKTKK